MPIIDQCDRMRCVCAALLLAVMSIMQAVGAVVHAANDPASLRVVVDPENGELRRQSVGARRSDAGEGVHQEGERSDHRGAVVKRLDGMTVFEVPESAFPKHFIHLPDVRTDGANGAAP